MVDSAAGCEFRDDLASLAARPPPRSGLPHAARLAASVRHALARISRTMVLGAVRRRIPGLSDSGQAELDNPGAASGAGGRGRCGGRGRRSGFRAAASQAPDRGPRRGPSGRRRAIRATGRRRARSPPRRSAAARGRHRPRPTTETAPATGPGHRRRERRAKRRPPHSSASPPCAGNARARASSAGGADGAAHARDPSPRVRASDRSATAGAAARRRTATSTFRSGSTDRRRRSASSGCSSISRTCWAARSIPVPKDRCASKSAPASNGTRYVSEAPGRLTPAPRGRQTARRAGGEAARRGPCDTKTTTGWRVRSFLRHSHEGGNLCRHGAAWRRSIEIPAFAGMTK